MRRSVTRKIANVAALALSMAATGAFALLTAVSHDYCCVFSLG